jgi:peptidoglycan/LPS O-acetylase OafA/YrhL
VALSLAVWSARRHDVRAHRRWATGSYLGLLGAGIAAMAVPTRLVPQTALHAPWALFAALVGVSALAVICIQLAARIRPGTSPERHDALQPGVDELVR